MHSEIKKFQERKILYIKSADRLNTRLEISLIDDDVFIITDINGDKKAWIVKQQKLKDFLNTF